MLPEVQQKLGMPVMKRALAVTVACVAILMAAAAAIAARGDGDSSGSAVPSESEKGKAQHHPLGSCTKARLGLGRQPKTIDFVVWCEGGVSEKNVGFVLGRVILPNPGVHTGIVGVDPAPLIAGPGIRRSGRCQLLRGQVACRGLSPGEARFTGTFSVRSKPCRWSFAVVTTLASSDEQEGWSGAHRIKTLSRGRPRGCGTA